MRVCVCVILLVYTQRYFVYFCTFTHCLVGQYVADNSQMDDMFLCALVCVCNFCCCYHCCYLYIFVHTERNVFVSQTKTQKRVTQHNTHTHFECVMLRACVCVNTHAHELAYFILCMNEHTHPPFFYNKCFLQ